MRYQRCTLCRKTKISYSLVPFSSPCNRSSNFIVNHHVSVLFSPLSLSLFPSFPLPMSFFVRVLRYTPSNSFHCRCLLSATITRRVKDPSGNVNPILSPVYLLRCASNFRHCISTLYRELSSPLSDSLYARPERARSWYCCRILRASSPWPRFLSLFFFSDFCRSCPRLFAFRRRLLRLLFEKQSESDF